MGMKWIRQIAVRFRTWVGGKPECQARGKPRKSCLGRKFAFGPPSGIMTRRLNGGYEHVKRGE